MPSQENATLTDRLNAHALRKHAQFAARPELLACALTGSLAHGRVWDGSDLDFIAIQTGPEDESQKAGVIGQTRELLEQIARVEAPSG